MNNANKTIDVYAIVTDRIIEQLEKQVVPWRKPWTEAGHPQNLFTKRAYTGINTWMLASLGYAQNYFLTFKQLKEAGGSVRKGEKGAIVIFWKPVEREKEKDGEDTQKSKYILRYYYVYNIAQCNDLPETISIPFEDHGISLLGACEEIIERMPNCPVIKHSKHQACYDPIKDCITMPKQGTFGTPESYYGTLFHELVHSTGHQSRLNRKEIAEPNKYGSEPYSIEELTAEIGACYLNSVAGIIHKEFDNSVAYINGWIRVLKNDKRMLVYASGQAQRATDYILNVPAFRKSEDATIELEAQTP